MPLDPASLVDPDAGLASRRAYIDPGDFVTTTMGEDQVQGPRIRLFRG